jgi:hypothetical protein
MREDKNEWPYIFWCEKRGHAYGIVTFSNVVLTTDTSLQTCLSFARLMGVTVI